MQGVLNILQVVRQRGALSFTELERETALESSSHTAWFGLAVDTCIDEGLLRRCWKARTPLSSDVYELTPRGRVRLSDVSLSR